MLNILIITSLIIDTTSNTVYFLGIKKDNSTADSTVSRVFWYKVHTDPDPIHKAGTWTEIISSIIAVSFFYQCVWTMV